MASGLIRSQLSMASKINKTTMKEINEQCVIIHNEKALLRDTDYVVIRATERGEAIDEATKERREEARRRINAAEAVIRELEEAKELEEERDS